VPRSSRTAFLCPSGNAFHFGSEDVTTSRIKTTQTAARNFFSSRRGAATTCTSFQDKNNNNRRNIHSQNNINNDIARAAGTDSNSHSNSSNLNNYWHPLLYINPWEEPPQGLPQPQHSSSSCFLQPLLWLDDDDSSSSSSVHAHAPPEVQAVDVATRHLIQLLQEVYHYGHAKNVVRSGGGGSSSSSPRQQGQGTATTTTAASANVTDHVPLSRCVQVLQSLGALPVHVIGRAERADAILILLQLIDQKQQQQQQRAADPHHHRTHFAPLQPNHDTYRIVLQLYATTTATSSPSSSTHDDYESSMAIPLRAQELIQQMQDVYRVHGDLEMKPHAYHYNRVLYCWQECRHDVNRILYATTFFLQNLHNGLNATSYVVIMRLCASDIRLVADRSKQHHIHNHRNNNTSSSLQQQQQQAVKVAGLGAKAAIRIWQVTMEQPASSSQSSPLFLDLPSHFYAHFLQAIRPLSDETGPNDFALRKEYYTKCFVQARERGKLNEYILLEFIVHVKSKTLTHQLLGENLMQTIYGVSPAQRAVQVLLKNMPLNWKNKSTEDQGTEDNHLLE
jgi:hypothetical protein